MLLEVVPGLFLGDRTTALRGDLLLQNGVSLVVSAGGGSSLCLPYSIKQINMRLRDNNKDSFLGQIDHVAQSIEAELKANKKVLVHCQAGLSRSPAVIAGFLLLKRGLSVSDALDVIKSVRPSASPSQKFLLDIHLLLQKRGTHFDC